MNIALLKENICIDVSVFDNIETAGQFLEGGAWPEADAVAELPDDCGIGDMCDNGQWTKKPESEAHREQKPAESEFVPDEITQLQLAIIELYERMEQNG